MYKDKTLNKTNLSKAEQISKNFNHLVMQNYTTQRSVAWYAKKLGITPAHLSTIVKQTTDKTCVEIITSMVIMDAKAQLKSTDLSIHDIAYSLNFTNMSFFGKYFKRHVGDGAVGIPEQLKTKVPGRWVISASPPCTTRLATSPNR